MLSADSLIVVAPLAALVVCLAGALILVVERYGRRWLDYWHGAGETQQFQFYRCMGCHKLVTHAMIERGGCRCRLPGCTKVQPTAVLFREKVRLLALPWTVR